MQPFTTFRATIKRFVSSGFTPARAAAFRDAFPGFLELPGEAPADRSALQPPRRRYSGAIFAVGLPLARARYATVCVDASGADADGLSRELRAYASAALRGRLVIHDLGRAARALHLRCGGWSFGGRLGLRFDDDPDSSLYERYASLGPVTRLEGAGWSTHLDYEVAQVCIENTVDLRLPYAQEWFFETFRGGFPPFWRKREDPCARGFHDMLPTLMTAELGGNAATDAVGRVLRASGARALVYPAARSDPDSIVHRGTLRASVGFNLVDFGDTPVAGDGDRHAVFDDPEPWGSSVFWPRLRCEVAELGRAAELDRPFRGSWRLRGVRDAHERFWERGGHLGVEPASDEQAAIRATAELRRTLERVGWDPPHGLPEEPLGGARGGQGSRTDQSRREAERRGAPNEELGRAHGVVPEDRLR